MDHRRPADILGARMYARWSGYQTLPAKHGVHAADAYRMLDTLCNAAGAISHIAQTY